MVKAISLDPKATIEASKADICLHYKHCRQARKHKQKLASMQKEFSAMFQLSLIPRNYQNLCVFGVHIIILFTHNGA